MATTKMDLTFQVKDRPKPKQLIVFALQQLLAIMAATIAVPAITNGEMLKIYGADNFTPMTASAALFGAGVGTIVYLLFTRFKSPVFLGSSFAFLGSMAAAFGGGISMSAGYLGLIIGAVLAGLVYVVIAVVVKFCGTQWINKLMPPVVIGPTVAIIGLSLAVNSIKDIVGASAEITDFDSIASSFVISGESFAYLACGLVTLFTVVITSVYGKKFMKMIPFVLGILAGYIVATIFTLCGIKIINFSAFKAVADGSSWYPQFTFLEAFSGSYSFGDGNFGTYLGTIAVAYIPVAFVVFAEHIADHKNLSSIIGEELLENPGLHRTLLGDGVGSIAGAFFGGCPNTTYGESVGCVAISGNASVITIFVTACMAILISFIAPISILLASIPSCVMGGVCLTLYGFIAVSGLKMIQDVDLNKKHNLFVASAIFIAGVGGMSLKFGAIKLTSIAVALILGILVNLVCLPYRKKYDARKAKEKEAEENK